MDTGITDATNYLDPAMASRLRQGVRQGGDKSTLAVARQFESLMLQVMMKSMRDAVPKTGFMNSSATDTYQDLYDKEIAQQISRRGMGLAEMIVRQMNKGTPPPSIEADATSSAAGTAGPGLPLERPAVAMPLATSPRTLHLPGTVTDGLSLRLRLHPAMPATRSGLTEAGSNE